MRQIYSISIFALLMVSSCSSQTQNSLAPTPQETKTTMVTPMAIVRDSIITLSLTSNHQQSFSIYYPYSAPTPAASAILVCFDPHAGGSIPIEKYRKLADRFGIAIAGSNSSKNGMSVDESRSVAENMETELIQRLGFNKKNMTLCGFSGGAKVALSGAYADPDIARAIYIGASLPFSASHPISLMGFAGQQDMNYSDLLQFNESLGQTHPGYNLLVEYNGKHEWPESTVFEKAFYWLAITNSNKDSLAKPKRISELASSLTHEIAISEQKKDLLTTFNSCQTAMFVMKGITDISFYQNKASTLSKDPNYVKALQNKKMIVSDEAKQKQLLIPSFQNQNADWWAKVIKNYTASPNPSDKRLLGFISLACYSYSNQLIQQRNIEGAEKILTIYELCDAQNTDQLYFHAELYALKGDLPRSISYLKTAVTNGFSDSQKLDSDPILEPLKSDKKFIELSASLHKVPR